MSHKITVDCINCGTSENECPVNAISESCDKRIIDIELCIDCGSCVTACPVEAILAP